jgi:uncharacterized protein YjbJ (UPF0337 family)
MWDSVQTLNTSWVYFCDRERWKFNTTLWSIVEINYQEKVMEKNQVTGRIKEAEGKTKEITGKILGNKKLEEKGKAQKTAGKIEAGYGDLKNNVKNRA